MFRIAFKTIFYDPVSSSSFFVVSNFYCSLTIKCNPLASFYFMYINDSTVTTSYMHTLRWNKIDCASTPLTQRLLRIHFNLWPSKIFSFTDLLTFYLTQGNLSSPKWARIDWLNAKLLVSLINLWLSNIFWKKKMTAFHARQSQKCGVDFQYTGLDYVSKQPERIHSLANYEIWFMTVGHTYISMYTVVEVQVIVVISPIASNDLL